MRSVIVIAAALSAAALLSPAIARGDGGPVGVIRGGSVGVPGATDRYVALDWRTRTFVQRMRNGDVVDWRLIGGRYGVAGAAYDGSTTGLSADGRTLVLAGIATRFPQRVTKLIVLDAHRLRIERRIALRGFFTVDAISPHGDRIYLVHYKDASGLRYEVLAYDVRRRRLSRRPIVDPREPGEKMLGTPVTRAVSHDGRWAYTLYARADDAPFIHALDTNRGTAACVDLDSLARADPSTLRLEAPPGGGPLRVVSAAGTQALVDRRTFAVSRPRIARPVQQTSGAGPPWAAAAGALAVVAALAAIAAVRRRRYERSASFRNAS